MTTNLLQKLEEKIANALDTIELMRLQIDALEQENTKLKTEQDKWHRDLKALLSRFEQIESSSHASVNEVDEEETMTV